MEAKAYLRNCRIAPRKVQIVLDLIRGQDLKKAQEEPDEYRDLIVRVAGYSAYFVELNRNTQNEIIARTEYEELC